MNTTTQPAEVVGSSAELGLVVGRAYPATGAAQMPLSPVTVVNIGWSTQRTYTQAELDAAVAAERERCRRIAARFKIPGAIPDEYEGGCDSTASLIEEMIQGGSQAET